MMRTVLTAVLLVTTATAAWAEGLFWVVGNRATSRCEIVTSNPVVTIMGGDIWFASGPFKSWMTPSWRDPRSTPAPTRTSRRRIDRRAPG